MKDMGGPTNQPTNQPTNKQTNHQVKAAIGLKALRRTVGAGETLRRACAGAGVHNILILGFVVESLWS
jgi:hypothetical protein